MQNWFDPSKETEAARWTKPEKAMACLRASLSPAARAVYKYSLGLSEQDQSKPHMVINDLKEYYGASIGVSGGRQKLLSLLQNEEESIASWETRIRNQAARCEYENFGDELMRDQFIAGLTSEPLRVKTDWERSKIETRQNQKSLYEKSFANHAVNEKCPRHPAGAGKLHQDDNPENHNSDTLTAACFWCRGEHPSRSQQHCPAFGKRCNECEVIGHFARACEDGSSKRSLRKQPSFFAPGPLAGYSKRIFSVMILPKRRLL